jgi:glycosyltransferase involved in cell wall biosynthesis
MGALAPSLKRDGVELRSWSSFADDVVGGASPPPAGDPDPLRALGLIALAWCDVVVFRRWTLTHVVCSECGRPELSRNTLGEHLRSSGHRSVVADLVLRPLIDLLTAHPELLDGRGVLYETDDDVLAYPDWTGFGPTSRLERDLVLRLLSLADLVTVTTPILASRLRPHTGGEVRVVRNAVDPAWYEPGAAEPGLEGEPRVVYHGAPVRLRDYAVARPAVDSLARERPGTRRVWLGAAHEPQVTAAVDEVRPWVDGVPAFAAALVAARPDIGLGPLLDEPFNRAKSELHWIEYALAGAPAIVSGFPGGGPYEVVRDGVDGLVATDPGDWLRHLRALAGSRGLRDEIAGRARERILAEYTVAGRAQEWSDAYRWAAQHPGYGRSARRRAS